MVGSFSRSQFTAIVRTLNKNAFKELFLRDYANDILEAYFFIKIFGQLFKWSVLRMITYWASFTSRFLPSPSIATYTNSPSVTFKRWCVLKSLIQTSIPTLIEVRPTERKIE